MDGEGQLKTHGSEMKRGSSTLSPKLKQAACDSGFQHRTALFSHPDSLTCASLILRMVSLVSCLALQLNSLSKIERSISKVPALESEATMCDR